MRVFVLHCVYKEHADFLGCDRSLAPSKHSRLIDQTIESMVSSLTVRAMSNALRFAFLRYCCAIVPLIYVPPTAHSFLTGQGNGQRMGRDFVYAPLHPV